MVETPGGRRPIPNRGRAHDGNAAAHSAIASTLHAPPATAAIETANTVARS